MISFARQKAHKYGILAGMNEQLPRVSVTVVAFTGVPYSAETSGPMMRERIHTGSGSRDFGLGLFAITRQSNPEQFLGADDGKRVLPATLVGADETVRDAARRMLKSELGIERRGVLRETGLFDAVHREGDQRVITVGYWVYVPLEDVSPVLGGKDKVGLELVTSSSFIDEWDASHDLSRYDGVSRFGHRLRPTQQHGHKKTLSKELNGESILALDHDDIVFYSWRKLRHGFVSALDPIRFLGINPLPPEFSLSDLREVYDVSRGERFHPDAFRRAMVRDDGFITPVGRTSDSSAQGRGKPASLFTLKHWVRPQ